jgi:hypothetical protein
MQNLHHLTYHRLYNERLEDLAGLCDECHASIHRRDEQDQTTETRLEKVRTEALFGTVCDYLYRQANSYLTEFERDGWTVVTTENGNLEPKKLRLDATWDGQLATRIFDTFAQDIRAILNWRDLMAKGGITGIGIKRGGSNGNTRWETQFSCSLTTEGSLMADIDDWLSD